MSVLQYMNLTGLRFWSSTPVSLLVGLGEWVALLFFICHYGDSPFGDRRSRLLHTVMLACSLFVQFQHFQVALHCLALMVLCTVYICLLTGCGWFSAVFESSLFCLSLELGKSLCRDGLLAGGLSRMLGVEGIAMNLIMLGMYIVYLVLLCFLFSRRRRQALYLPITAVQTMALLFPFFLYLAIRLVQYGQVERLDNLQWFRYDLLQYAVAVCALLVMGTTENMLASRLELDELTHRQRLIEEKQRQYEQERETMEFVNHRWHDMKHYIAGIEAILADVGANREADIAQARELIDGLRQGIDPYGDIHRTGNSVMDVLLFQKTQACRQKNIRLIPFIDASEIGFISTLDLSAMFGNALDNAIEAVDELEDPALREIRVKIGTSDQLLLMRFQNRFRGERRMERGWFQTTKANSQGHGFGLSTIAAIAEKYGGTMTTEIADDVFTVHVLIPLPDQKQDGEQP